MSTNFNNASSETSHRKYKIYHRLNASEGLELEAGILWMCVCDFRDLSLVVFFPLFGFYLDFPLDYLFFSTA